MNVGGKVEEKRMLLVEKHIFFGLFLGFFSVFCGLCGAFYVFQPVLLA